MPNRWPAGALLFTLGFGSATMLKLPATQAASKEGVVEGNLKYVNVPGGNFQLIYPKPDKAKTFLIVGQLRSRGGDTAEKQVALRRGNITYGKEQRKSMMIYSVTPVMKVTQELANPCDGPVLCTFPPDGDPFPGPRPQTLALDQFRFDFMVPDIARRPGP